MPADIPMPHPGVVLREEFLEPMGLSVYALAKAIHAAGSTTSATAVRASPRRSRYASAASSTSTRRFMNMQSKYDLHVEAERLKAELAAIEPRNAA